MKKRAVVATVLLAAVAVGLWVALPRVGRDGTAAHAQSNDVQVRQGLAVLAAGADVPVSGGMLAAGMESASGAGATQGGVVVQQAGPLPAGERGLSVQGQGQATAAANTARLQFTLMQGGGPVPMPAIPGKGEGGSPVPMPAVSPITADDVKPVVDALVAAGVPSGAIEVDILPMGAPYGRGIARVTVTINAPTQSGLRKIVTAASDAAIQTGKLMLQNVGAQFGVNDCTSLEKTARTAAVSNAKDRVAALAAALGVQVGDVLFASEYPSFGPFGPGAATCGNSPKPVPVPGYFPPYDPSAPPQVTVTTMVNVAWGIK